VKTDDEQVAWARRYRRAVRRFLQQGPSANPRPAVRLGRQAVDLGLETLDVARIHAQALTGLASLSGASRTTGHKIIGRAESFFTLAIVPIEATHSATLESETRIVQLAKTLRRSSQESSAVDRELKRATAKRREAEAALKKSAERHAKLLAEAEELQNHLRHRLRDILLTQEDERDCTSRELRNEVAQALVAIDLSLLALKTSADVNREKLEKGIAKAQRLIQESLRREGT